MADKQKKISGWLVKGKIAVAVGRTVLTGKASKTFDKVDQGIEIGEKALEIAGLVKKLIGP